MERKIWTPLLTGMSLVVIFAGIGITTIWNQDPRREGHETNAVLQGQPDDVSKENHHKLEQAIQQLNNNNDDLEQRSSLLDREVVELRKQLEDMQTKQEDTPKATEDSEEVMDSKEQMEKMQARVEAQNTLIEESLLAEDSDPDWAGAMQTSLDEMLRDEQMQGVQLGGIDCRATLCRVNLHSDNSRSAETSIRMLGHVDIGAGQGFFRIDELEDGSGEITMYVAKAGHELPQVQE